MVDDAQLTRAYRAAMGEKSDHPSDEVWERLTCGELSTDENEEVLDHITRCEICIKTYRALNLLRSEAHTFDPDAPTPEPVRITNSLRPYHRRLAFGGLAALAAAAVFCIVFLPSAVDDSPLGNGQPEIETLRSGSHSLQPELFAPVGQVNTIEGGFSWRTAEPVQTFIVEVFDANGEPLWTSPETESPQLTWPAELTATPGRYYWRVIAIPAEGGEQAISELKAFDLGP